MMRPRQSHIDESKCCLCFIELLACNVYVEVSDSLEYESPSHDVELIVPHVTCALSIDVHI